VAGIFSGCIRARDNHQARRKRATRGHKLIWVIAAFTEGGMRETATLPYRSECSLWHECMYRTYRTYSMYRTYGDERREPQLDPH